MVSGTSLKVGDIVLVEAGDIIPSDGEVIEGVASVNEAAITGESAPVIRESGGDRSAVTGGTQVLSDWIRVRITAAQGSTFIDRMIKLVEGAERQKTPNEIALNILLAGLTIIFVFATVDHPELCGLCRRLDLGGRAGGAVRDADPDHHRRAAVGDRHCRHGSAGALQRAGHVRPRGRSGGRRRYAAARQDRHHHARQPPGDRVPPVRGVTEQELADAAQLASLADETPEGRSIVVLAKEKYGIRGRDMAELRATFIPFTAQTRMSGVDAGGSSVRKGAVDAILNYVSGGTRAAVASGNAVRAMQPAVSRDGARNPGDRRRDRQSRAARRWPSRGTAGCSASSTSRTSSRAASASASPNCAAWASAP